ncbi:glycosyltransferase family A protein [Psychrobacillus soli]|uniref:Glycosyltransferase family 2 protein n=1 Tax=Psychrobacillus soli TaxID=1543965 RepID=A0A544T5M1_9BACI|nr:glycosyltransferase family A protein [Psychrobacillus soli]TQR12716.1 glycosyltransferase family 2 protein [Psychrobacillus soli]
MNLQVLVSTMYQDDHSLLEKMNIQSDAIFINQCNKNDFQNFVYKGNEIKFLSFAERGIGLSRNNALMRATADICLFADDDVTYVDNYKDIIINAFKSNPKANIIVFNVQSTNPEREEYIIHDEKRLRFYNCLRYGTFRVAIRTESLRKKNIYFSLLFGGGAKYGSGEDSILIMDSLKKGLKIYASPEKIGTVTHKESTWFNGYTDKFFIDKGALFYNISRRWASLLSLQFVIRKRSLFKDDKKILEAFKLLIKGIRNY